MLAEPPLTSSTIYDFICAAVDFECTHHLQLILPKLLLVRLIQKRELSDMMHKKISQNR